MEGTKLENRASYVCGVNDLSVLDTGIELIFNSTTHQ